MLKSIADLSALLVLPVVLDQPDIWFATMKSYGRTYEFHSPEGTNHVPEQAQ